MKKFASILILLGILNFAPVAWATGILPAGSEAVRKGGCADYFDTYTAAYENIDAFKMAMADLPANRKADLLGCAIKSGKIHLYMLPYFVVYLIEYLLGLAGIIAVLFMVYGGYQYVVGGITEDKESGKKTITHALIGLLVALTGWIAINYVQVILTS